MNTGWQDKASIGFDLRDFLRSVLGIMLMAVPLGKIHEEKYKEIGNIN